MALYRQLLCEGMIMRKIIGEVRPKNENLSRHNTLLSFNKTSNKDLNWHSKYLKENICEDKLPHRFTVMFVWCEVQNPPPKKVQHSPQSSLASVSIAYGSAAAVLLFKKKKATFSSLFFALAKYTENLDIRQSCGE